MTNSPKTRTAEDQKYVNFRYPFAIGPSSLTWVGGVAGRKVVGAAGSQCTAVWEVVGDMARALRLVGRIRFIGWAEAEAKRAGGGRGGGLTV